MERSNTIEKRKVFYNNIIIDYDHTSVYMYSKL